LISKVGVPVDLYQNGNPDAVYKGVDLTIDMIYKGVKDIPTANNSFTFIPGQYTAGAGSIIMFCLPAAALAMMSCVPKGDNRRLSSSIFLSSAFVSFFTGITEPIEFTFLFLAP
jgi:phosphotransferase system  glucose/maltose/N-acetylglucosamine-specific IIC component